MGPTRQEEKARFAFETFGGKTFTEGRARSNLIWWEAEHRTHHEWGGKETANIPAVCCGPLLLWVKNGVRGSKKIGGQTPHMSAWSKNVADFKQTASCRPLEPLGRDLGRPRAQERGAHTHVAHKNKTPLAFVMAADAKPPGRCRCGAAGTTDELGKWGWCTGNAVLGMPRRREGAAITRPHWCHNPVFKSPRRSPKRQKRHSSGGGMGPLTRHSCS